MTRLRCLLALLVPLLTVQVVADEEQVPAEAQPASPKSSAARTIVAKHDAAAEKARAAYDAALVAADKQLVKNAAAALNRALDEKNLETANELNALKTAAEKRLKSKRGNAAAGNVIIAIEYGEGDKWLDVAEGVEDRLSKGQDLWVDDNITDGRPASGGDLRIRLRAADGKPVTILCRQGSRLFIKR